MNYNDFLANGISQFKTRSNDNVKIRFTESGSFTIEHLNSKVSSDADNKITSLLGNYSSGSTYGNTNLDFGIFSPFMNTNNYLNTFFSKDLNNPIYGFSNSGFSKSETTTSVPASNENPWNNVSSLNEILSKIFAHMKEDDNTISDQKTEIDKLREENKKLNDQLLKEQEKTKSLSDSISKLEKENKLDDAKIAELVKENSIDDALIAKLKKENKLDDETIDKLNKQVSHYKEEILNLSSVISDLQKENKLDDAKIAELVKENKIDDATIEKLEKQGKLDKITIAKLKQKIAELSKLNDPAERDKQKLEELKLQIRKITEENEYKREQIMKEAKLTPQEIAEIKAKINNHNINPPYITGKTESSIDQKSSDLKKIFDGVSFKEKTKNDFKAPDLNESGVTPFRQIDHLEIVLIQVTDAENTKTIMTQMYCSDKLSERKRQKLVKDANLTDSQKASFDKQFDSIFANPGNSDIDSNKVLDPRDIKEIKELQAIHKDILDALFDQRKQNGGGGLGSAFGQSDMLAITQIQVTDYQVMKSQITKILIERQLNPNN